MNIYLLERQDSIGYDQFDGAVVLAESEQRARMIHPMDDESLRPLGSWWDGARDTSDMWIDADSPDLRVTYIGISPNEHRPKVILASYCAG